MRDRTNPEHYDIVIPGAGYAGLMAALHLRSRKDPNRRVALVNAGNAFVERIRLQESVSRLVASRIPSIGALLSGSGVDFIAGRVTELNPDSRRVRIFTPTSSREIGFDRAIFALGSSTDVASVPGVDDHAFRLDPGGGPLAAAALRETLMRRAGERLRLVVVGGNETGIEVAGEVKAQWPLIDVTIVSRRRCGDIRGPRPERALRAELAHLGVRILEHQAVKEVRADAIVTADGQSIACDICVWSGGMKANPIAHTAGLATDAQGCILTDPLLRSVSHPHIFAAGDAARPLAPTGAPYRMSAFVALASGAYIADVINAERPIDHRPFSFSAYGQGIAVGRRGVGFAAFPNDRQRFFMITGRSGYHIRNLFVWFVSYLLKLERKHPGFFSFIWFGQRRVTWQQANHAMQNIQRTQAA